LSSTIKVVPNGAAAWQALLQTWDLFADHTYVSWSFAYAHPSFYHQWTVTMGLSGGGSDTVVVIPVDVEYTDVSPIMYLFGLPGWRTTSPKVYQDPLWDGNSPYDDYASGPLLLRRDIALKYTGVGAGYNQSDYTGTRLGVQIAWWSSHYIHDLILAIDTTQLVFGVLSGTTFQAQPTDGVVISPATVYASGGSGGAPIDLTPVVAALEDIASVDVTYTANNGGAIWSMRGKVNAE
jgi:hypothetical protein